MDLTGRAADSLLMSEITAEIGAIKKTMQDPTTFNEENLGFWMLMNGQSCTGTLYATVFEIETVPDAYTEGTFFRQAKMGVATGEYQGDAIRNITGRTLAQIHEDGGGSTGAFYHTHAVSGEAYEGSGNSSYYNYFDASRVVPTADENRPKNIAINYMIKVNH